MTNPLTLAVARRALVGSIVGLVASALLAPKPLHAVESTPDVFTPVLASVLAKDTAPVLGSDGRLHVVYELQITNASAVPATIERVDVVTADGGASIKSFADAGLVESMRSLDARPTTSADLVLNESKLLLVSLDFPADQPVPERIAHRISGRGGAAPAGKEPVAMQYTVAPLDLPKKELPRFQPPLAGSGWLTLNGCCGLSGAHRGAILPINGALWDAQRFAIDWMRVDAKGRLVREGGDPKKVEDYVGYGATILAAADGVVVAAEDDLPNQIPGVLPDPKTITVANIDGNHVVIDHGGGVFTFYAHMQPGSVSVEPGRQVKAGDKLGLLGNTGNTSAPHLHFHAMSGSSPIGSDGIPYTLDVFVLAGKTDEAGLDRALAGGALEMPKEKPVQLDGALPLDMSLVEFK